MINNERIRQAYERGLRPGTDLPGLDDVAAERLRRLVEREGSDEERLHTLDQQLSTAEGRRELELVWAAARAARPRSRLRPVWLAAASALLMVGVAGTWLATRETARVERGEVSSPITLIAPLGTRGDRDASQFIWRPVPDAERYTLVVVDTSGSEVFAAETRDTAVTLPDTVHFERGRDYPWWVQAKTRYGASITAVTERLTITGK